MKSITLMISDPYQVVDKRPQFSGRAIPTLRLPFVFFTFSLLCGNNARRSRQEEGPRVLGAESAVILSKTWPITSHFPSRKVMRNFIDPNKKKDRQFWLSGFRMQEQARQKKLAHQEERLRVRRSVNKGEGRLSPELHFAEREACICHGHMVTVAPLTITQNQQLNIINSMKYT